MRKIFQSTLLKYAFQPKLVQQTPAFCISHLKKDQQKNEKTNSEQKPEKPTATPKQQEKSPLQNATQQAQDAGQKSLKQQQLEQKKKANQEKLNKELTELEKKKENEQLEMISKHQALSKEVNDSLNIPFKLFGWLQTPPTKTAYMGERVFAQHRLPKHMVLNHLYKIFSGTLYSMAAQDEEFLFEYCEKTYAETLVKRIKSLKEKGYTFKVEEDVTGIKGEPVEKFSYVVDMVMVRGLSIDRSENDTPKAYHKWVDIEDMGLVVYTPNSVQDPANFIDPKKNKTAYDPYKKVLMRMLVHIKSPIRFRVFKPDGSEIHVDPNMYTWEHLALFETQMKPPQDFKSYYKLENYMEWLGKFEFGVWKMADLDNWMLGNPLFLKDNEREMYKDKIFKGSKYDPEENIDIRRV